jgi:hypothetical protein
VEVINRTPYEMERVVIFDRTGRETLLVMVKGTFDFSQGATVVAEKQAPIVQADEYYGDPAKTSIRLTSDFLPVRLNTGVTLSGHAVVKGGKAGRMNIGIRVGSLMQKAVVFGDRAGYGHINEPIPFERMPLTWENAYGGLDTSHDNSKHNAAHAANPVGKGFIAKRSKLNSASVALPNIEDPDHLIKGPFDQPQPVGLGPVPPFWEARSKYAGTYDDAWTQERAPLLPDDFDERFLQAAPVALTAEGYLKGNERCDLVGMTEEGRVQFDLNASRPTIGVRFASKGIRSNPVLESLHFDTDARQFYVTWKSMLDIQGKVEELKNIEARII